MTRNLRVAADDFDHAVHHGDTGMYTILKYGRNATVPATYETLWSGSSVYVYRDTAIVMKISSSDVNDVMTSGSGAWSIIILGLNANYELIQEEVELNGQTEVNTQNAYLRVFRMKVNQAASRIIFNAGIIYAGTGTVTTGVPANVFGRIEIGQNQSEMGMITVPANTTAWIKHILPSTTISNKVSDVRLLVRSETGPWQMKRTAPFLTIPQNADYMYGIEVAAKSDIEFQGKAAAGGGDMGIEFELLFEMLIGDVPDFTTLGLS